ncbi:lipolysis-stimulated lipoprotein receptor [Chanos chanos]|uniref:Lipolysis-stimulated lipoprotein receptor n=1 Tax=Chanos chanos TaxID=29144 RepID=A0A6J2W508_CHACN|nr:lipolysis-stimulated lipoprotein receptor [Chanos chanos]
MIGSIFLAVLTVTGTTMAVNVNCPVKKYVVILFQPVTLQCNYDTRATVPPLVTWKYKSFCRDPIQAALNPSSAENALAQSNPNYNPNIECSDQSRTVRIVASKQTSVTLGTEYQGRRISIINNADLNIAQTAWGDSGVYICSVASAQDLSGNGEDYTELIVLDWLLVVLVVLGFLLLLLFIGICWCQCCPHTCCCYVSCPCCPERCCCPRALYEAGKAVKSGVPSQYAPTLYAQSMYSQPAYGMGGANPSIPMLPMPQNTHMPMSNDYGRDYDGASSVGQGSQVPLLQDHDRGPNQTRSGYRIQADHDGNPTRVLYYMERELANMDPGRPGDASVRRMDGMSEVSSLHDDLESRGRGRSRPPQLTTVYDDVEENMSTISSVSQQGRRDRYQPGGATRGYLNSRNRARSMDNLDIVRDHYDDPFYRRDGGARGGRRGSDDEWSSSARGGYDSDARRPRDSPPDSRHHGQYRRPGFQGRRSRSRDDLMDLDHGRNRGGRDMYDDSFLREAMERKKLNEQQRSRSRERLDSESERSDRSRGGGARGPPPLPLLPPTGYPDHRRDSPLPPPPPPYTEDNDSVASSKKSNLRKNAAVSRESLVV